MYQVLYRKYRPKVFSDVVGQDHITKTLSSEIETGKLSHAYLFTGSRGTGKTTCAKILSKAVNCLNPQNGNPCNECEICRGIDDGSILDVVEIDAASNNGVDNIRDIRDEAAFAPASCKYRVYIIDEVHMLSIGAFNALLKTLEEPPEHVKFILATTEVQKLPVTILSRCQRFDFKRVDPQSMKKRMMQIASLEDFTLEDEAASLIARLADGGMRDALSTLDQCVTRSKTVTTQLVSEVAGITGKEHLFAFAESVIGGDTANCIDIISKLYNNSFDMERLCGDLISHFRNLMIVKTVKTAENVLICTSEEIESYKQQSKKITLEAILYSIDLLQGALANIKRGVNRRIEMEMTAIRLASPETASDNKALLRRIAQLEQALRTGSIAVKATEEPPTRQEAEKPKQEEEPPKQPSAEAQSTAETKENSAASSPQETYEEFLNWPQVLSELAQINKPIWGVLNGSQAYIKNDFVLVKSDNPVFSSFIRTGTNARDVKEAIYNITGKKYRLGIYKQAETPAVKKQKDPLEGLLDKARELGVNINVE
ncbi:MAG: DNA polymerase III subunit gamma/tau [Acutalibacteraceae bacterium]